MHSQKKIQLSLWEETGRCGRQKNSLKNPETALNFTAACKFLWLRFVCLMIEDYKHVDPTHHLVIDRKHNNDVALLPKTHFKTRLIGEIDSEVAQES